MAGDGDDVGRLENAALSQDLLADLAEGQAVGRRVEVFDAAGVLDGLEGDAADTFLLQGEVDRLADLVVVQSFLEGDDERSGDVVLVEPLERLAADVGEVYAAQCLQRPGV